MRNIIPAMLAVAIIALPLGAVAGEPSAPAGLGPMPPGHFDTLNLTQSQRQACQQIMQQTHQQMEQLHAQARTNVLGALTPAHRTLLAQVVGSLAIAPNPDETAAVKQLDAALSPGEARAVLSAHSAAEQQMHSVFQAAHQRFAAILTPQQRAQLPGGGSMSPPKEMHEMRQLSAGAVLLHFASSEGMEHGHEMQMGHP